MARPSEIADLAGRWQELERRYAADEYAGTGAAGEVSVTAGVTVVVIAAHAVAHVRDGRRKRPELRTGGLADLVAAATGATALTSIGQGGGDPNWDAEHPVKDALRSVAASHRIALDLHGMSDRHGVDVCIGSGRLPEAGRELVAICVDTAAAAGLRAAVDRPYSAARSRTITSTAQRLGLAAVQLEIAAARRDLRRRPDAAAELAAWLIELVRRLLARLAPEPEPSGAL